MIELEFKKRKMLRDCWGTIPEYAQETYDKLELEEDWDAYEGGKLIARGSDLDRLKDFLTGQRIPNDRSNEIRPRTEKPSTRKRNRKGKRR